jgi:Ras-related protein Rab-32
MSQVRESIKVMDAREGRGAPAQRQLLMKIVCIGMVGCGKTSIIKRYVHGIHSQRYQSTIGVDFAMKVLQWDANTLIRLQLWDIGGQERYGNLTRVYYKEAVGAFVVFDVSQLRSFDDVRKWKNDLDSKVSMPAPPDSYTTTVSIPAVLLGNKIDLIKAGESWGKSTKEMEEFCKELGFITWVETSAKDGINLDLAVEKLVTAVLERVPLKSQDQDTVRLNVDPVVSSDGDCRC